MTIYGLGMSDHIRGGLYPMLPLTIIILYLDNSSIRSQSYPFNGGNISTIQDESLQLPSEVFLPLEYDIPSNDDIHTLSRVPRC